MRPFAPLLDLGVAFALLTRLPLPRLPDAAFAAQARAVWAFPLVGLCTGALAGGAGLLALAAGLPAGVAAGLVLAVQVIVTGAMHEDGLADAADGLWGGFTPERRLEIMRDSRIGSYGVLALILSLGLRWQAVAVLLPHGAWPVILAAVGSRAMMPALMRALPHARADGLSKGVGRPGGGAVLLGAALALGLGLALGGAVALPVLVAGGVMAVLAGALARARIGGQTGDILGATQQLAEIAMLLVCIAQLS
ncbi:adenosylcobinamide-GDP ribazoletransferase [Marinibacterium profundimaris]|uniref:Adenosylcobinamide-GDP ribazoletransferase n=1 Tax=Marinibacterium profundimaris TaxID=1679460 RepID=A0A225NK99_9RHOB|nr:adenosylcobinamide-GDP ribazoletransferase [Marinibacterium profundimaris]OWU69861.1 cobalamin biosynthesis protein CobS [Marinibacterium profundimaris]